MIERTRRLGRWRIQWWTHTGLQLRVGMGSCDYMGLRYYQVQIPFVTINIKTPWFCYCSDIFDETERGEHRRRAVRVARVRDGNW